MELVAREEGQKNPSGPVLSTVLEVLKPRAEFQFCQQLHSELGAYLGSKGLENDKTDENFPEAPDVDETVARMVGLVISDHIDVETIDPLLNRSSGTTAVGLVDWPYALYEAQRQRHDENLVEPQGPQSPVGNVLGYPPRQVSHLFKVANRFSTCLQITAITTVIILQNFKGDTTERGDTGQIDPIFILSAIGAAAAITEDDLFRF
jgi:hypothetical protein